MTDIKKARQHQIGLAFMAGRRIAREQIGRAEFPAISAHKLNPYSINGKMPNRLASVQGALYHAFDGGIERELGAIKSAACLIRNARYCMRRATEMGRA